MGQSEINEIEKWWIENLYSKLDNVDDADDADDADNADIIKPIPRKISQVECDICEKMFHKSGLSKHKNAIHNINTVLNKCKKIKCNMCGVRIRIDGIKKHQNTNICKNSYIIDF
ncbi:MAG: hypothetical protein N2B06_00520 [Clostridium sp.]